MFKVPSSSQNTSFMKPPTCYYHTARLLAAQGFNGVDQTYSITSNGGGGGDSNTTENTMRFHKTRMCSFHQKGACIKGSDCTYARKKRTTHHKTQQKSQHNRNTHKSFIF